MDRDGVSNHYFPVTRNLEEALRLLRLESRNRTFWIDAICINQKDDVERSAQVAMMRSIYSSAFRTVVYFGPEDEFSSKGMALIERLATTIHIDLLPKQGLPKDTKRIKDHPVKLLLPELDDIETIHQIYYRPVSNFLFLLTSVRMGKILDLFTPDVHASFGGSADLVQWWSRAWVAQKLVVAKDSILQ
jgi:hypothetical protein